MSDNPLRDPTRHDLAMDPVPSLRELLETLPQPLLVCDPQGVVLLANGAALHLLGADAHDALALQLDERATFQAKQRLHPHGLRELFMADVRVLGARQQTVSLTLASLESGSYRVQLLRPGAAPEDPGSPRELGPLLSRIDMPAALFDARRALCASNDPWDALVAQASWPVALGQDLLELIPEGSPREAWRVHLAQLLAGQRVAPLPLSLPGADAQDAHPALNAHLSALRATSGQPTGFLLVVMPAPKPAQAPAAQHAAQLERLGLLATNVAHELKNPMTSILNYAEFLLRKYRDQLFEPRDQERLRHIITGVERMDRFIQDLVELTRHPERRPYAPLALDALVREAAALCEPLLHERAVRLVLRLDDSPMTLLGDRVQLTQALVNLITNAAWACQPGQGLITLSARQDVGAGQAVLCVEDDGPGVPADLAERIFEPFFTTRKAQGGSGLGLVLVRAMIEHHGGALTLDRFAPLGARFTLTLPLMSSTYG